VNKRIKELAEQAGFEITTVTHIIYEPKQVFYGDSKNMQKLIELFIKECGVALNPMLRDMISHGQAHKLIKERFGVEQ